MTSAPVDYVYRAPSWRYEPLPPFRIYAVLNCDVQHYDGVEDLATAVEKAIKTFPPLTVKILGVVDQRNALVLAWGAPLGHMVRGYYGVAAAYEALAEVHDPIDVAIWEAQARYGSVIGFGNKEEE